MPRFGKSQKNPADVVKSLRDALDVLDKSQDKKKLDKANDELVKSISSIKLFLYGSAEQEPQQDVIAQLSQEIYSSSLLHNLLVNLHLIDFERKKDVTQIFNNLLRRQISSRLPTVEHIAAKPDILFLLLNGYENQDIALHCGLMLRECLRHESLCKLILTSPKFFDFFNYVEMSTFDISSDAFSTFKDTLTKHKSVVSEFLEEQYDKFFDYYQRLLNSENYVTRRQALKLLGELLLDRHNFVPMTKYISNEKNLKLMMNMLRGKEQKYSV
ncbi:CAB39L [Bugula neritina]|uniref:CAB39L n=1 Tax=Bugula neritina TaxID=10212 RepID=A0A7J7K473_BUGNE|nr:CAB39L [Bugula neritina]